MNRRIWVLKLGGSLASTRFLKNWVDLLARLNRHAIVVVPGGGEFADQVRVSQRKWGFDEHTAHRMALLAMHQYGFFLASFSPLLRPVASPDQIFDAIDRPQVAIWMPDADELEADGVPSSWEVSSDSLAAWLAGKITAEHLVLVKCCAESSIVGAPEELAARGIVDPAFPQFLAESGLALKIFHSSRFREFAAEISASGKWQDPG